MMNPFGDSFQFFRNLSERKCMPSNLPLLALGAGLMLVTGPAHAGNLLVNQSFETPPSGEVVPSGWTYFAPPTLNPSVHHYWVAGPDYGASAIFGTFFWKQWNAVDGGPNNVAEHLPDVQQRAGCDLSSQRMALLKQRRRWRIGPSCSTWIEVAFLGAAAICSRSTSRRLTPPVWAWTLGFLFGDERL
jgi:hypothetical protein